MNAPATMPGRQAGAADALPSPAAPADDAKTLATLQARAALAGWVLARLALTDGSSSYCLCKWGRQLPLPDLASVAQHLRRVGAPE